MRNGLAVGIPLTILQATLVPEAPLHPIDIANNFALADAIYTADRIEGPWYEPMRTRTRVAALASSVYYAGSLETLPMIPLVIGLHLGYTALKPHIAFAKPAVVAFCWTIAVYFAPLWHAHLPLGNPLTPAWFFLSLFALSHAADVVDIEDDTAREIYTPAVLMGRQEASQFAVTSVIAAAWIHSLAPSAFLPYYIVSLSVVVGIIAEDMALTTSLCVLGFIAILVANDIEVAGNILKATATPHTLAIDATVSLTDKLLALPQPLRKPAFDALSASIEYGDAVGSKVLDLYRLLVGRKL